MFNIRGDSLYYEDVRLGPSEGLYADTKELASLGKADGVLHMSMPMRIDRVFVAALQPSCRSPQIFLSMRYFGPLL